MSIISYDTLNNLQEISFIAGSSKVLTFACFEEDTTDPLDISNGTAVWVLCPYGEYDSRVIEKVGNIISTNSFTVQLNSTDTLYLSGKYMQQVILTDSYGNVTRPAQGEVIILPAIIT